MTRRTPSRQVHRMKTYFETAAMRGALGALLCAALPVLGDGQYSVDWYKIAGGGGSSAGGQYSLTGTIGQHDASGMMTGGVYSITGGFWSLIGAVQTPGAPNLAIAVSPGGNVVVSWPNTGSYTLQQTSTLGAPNAWTPSQLSVTTANGTNSVSLSSPAGNLFFRLHSP